MMHRLICRVFGQHSLYRVSEADYPDYAHMKCRYCGSDQWHREHGILWTSAPWPKPPVRWHINLNAINSQRTAIGLRLLTTEDLK